MGRLYETTKTFLHGRRALPSRRVFWSDDVRSLYESVLAELKRDAVITDYLPIFAVRKVKEILLRMGASGPGTLSLIRSLFVWI